MKSDRMSFGDDRGAILIIALYFAIFGVAILYLAIGAGEAVLHREHLQDAADSAALSGAIISARIMNVLVLINLIMVLLLAVMVTLKLIEAIAIIGMAIAVGLAWCTFGASLVVVPPLASLQQTVRSIYNSVQQPIFDALETLRDVGNELVDASPDVSKVVASGDVEYWRGVTAIDAAMAAPTVEALPVADDDFKSLCGRAGRESIRIANMPLSALPGIGEIFGLLEGPMQAISEALSQWFCGDGGYSAPDISQPVDVGYPQTVKAKQCKASASQNVTDTQKLNLSDPTQKNATTAECTQAEEYRLAAKPLPDGSCPQVVCGPESPYEQTAKDGREQCDPKAVPGAGQYRYQQQRGYVAYKWDGKAWVRGTPVWQETRLNVPFEKTSEAKSPCVREARYRSVWERDLLPDTPCGDLTTEGYLPGYGREIRTAEEPDRIQPVCTNECAPKEPPPKDEVEPTRTVLFQQVTHVFSCMRNEKPPVDVGLERGTPMKNVDQSGTAKKDGNPKSPKGIAKGVHLGSEQFQIRSLVLGSEQDRESVKLIRLSLWGRVDPSNPMVALKRLGGFAYAQAEYFYDGNGPETEWMWNLNWRARLRRFELPHDDDALDRLSQACRDSGIGRECTRLFDVLDDWKDLIGH